MTPEENPNVEVARDHHGIVRSLDHLQEPWSPESSAPGEASAQSVAHQYMIHMANEFGIPKDVLDRPPAQLLVPKLNAEDPFDLKLVEERDRYNDSTALTYQQTILGLPVWDAQIGILLDEKNQVINAHSRIHSEAPPPRKPQDDARFLKDMNENDLREVLGFEPDEGKIRINRQRLLVYLYNKDARQLMTGGSPDPEDHIHRTPTLVLRVVPDTIHDERYYVVREVLFTFPLVGWGDLHWRVFVEVETGSVLYLRALLSGITGWVFSKDPITKAGINGPKITGTAGDIAPMDLLREQLPLPDIVPTNPQALIGKYVQLKDIEAPNILPPTSTTGDFNGSVESDEFAAANAYFHVATLFNLLEQLGFSVKSLFKNTKLPLLVDHRAQNDMVNSQCKANKEENGTDCLLFGRAVKNSKIGMAADFRIVAHEFCHALLLEAVHSPSIGFAHSAGDALGAILCDPGTKAPDRFDTFPWITWLQRRHDREDLRDWAFGGTKYFLSDMALYLREQILSTTLFRIYRAIGGDAVGDLAKQTWASKYTVYLTIGGIALLATQPGDPLPYISSMMAADDKTVLGYPGGAVRKIVRWAFEKQGAYNDINLFGKWVTTRGPPPDIDVYINDGREGEYGYFADFDRAPGVWNRLAADKISAHQPPTPGITNYCYIAVKNRGAKPAQNIQVKLYCSLVSKPTTWPADFKEIVASPAPTVPAQLEAGSKESVVLGPFSWVPDKALPTHYILASVSALGDLSNIDPSSNLPCAKGLTLIEKLVPFDNNIAMRKM